MTSEEEKCRHSKFKLIITCECGEVLGAGKTEINVMSEHQKQQSKLKGFNEGMDEAEILVRQLTFGHDNLQLKNTLLENLENLKRSG